jgi:glycosyltransferase involved in cell wall biosynthesis
MRIWLVMAGEPLPTDGPHARLLRTGLLAERLVEMGHEVVWWTSSFDHYRKRQRAAGDQVLGVRAGYEIRLLHAPAYRRHTSLARLRNHAALARAFRRLAPLAPAPHVVLNSIPVVELADEVVRFARGRGVPVVTDVRDLHPDLHVDRLPRPLRPLGRLAALPMSRAATRALAGSDAVTGISRSFLDWGLARAGRPSGPADRVFPLGYPETAADDASVARAGEALRAAGVDPARRIVWYSGMFTRYMDLEAPIRAAERMRERGETRVQMVFTGAGNTHAQWERRAAGLSSVVFTGWAEAAALAWLRSVAWVGLAPYHREFHAVGNKVSEYMAAGLPILLSGVGDARERVEAYGCGWTYDMGDGEAFDRHLARLLDEPGAYERLSAAGREAYRAHYSADVVYGAMAEHLAGLAAPARAGAAA